MRKALLLLALAAVGLSHSGQAQISKFHGDLGVGLVPMRSTAPDQANPYGYSGIMPGYELKTVDADFLLLNGSVGYDTALLRLGEGEQALGLSLNIGLGLLATMRQDLDGLNKAILLDFPEYLTYRYGAKAVKKAKSDFGVGVGLGYRFCKFALPFNSPSAMLEGVYATADADWFIRFSADLRPQRFYNEYSSEGPVEVLRIRQFNCLIGKSF